MSSLKSVVCAVHVKGHLRHDRSWYVIRRRSPECWGSRDNGSGARGQQLTSSHRKIGDSVH